MMSEYLRLMGQKMFEIIKLRNHFSVYSREEIFFFSSRGSRPTLRPTQPPVQLVLGRWEWGRSSRSTLEGA